MTSHSEFKHTQKKEKFKKYILKTEFKLIKNISTTKLLVK
jgi:hypothetical protein